MCIPIWGMIPGWASQWRTLRDSFGILDTTQSIDHSRRDAELMVSGGVQVLFVPLYPWSLYPGGVKTGELVNIRLRQDRGEGTRYLVLRTIPECNKDRMCRAW